MGTDGTIKDNQPMTDRQLKEIRIGTNHADPNISHRCRMYLLQAMNPGQWGDPRETVAALIHDLRKANRS
jgi:hypothetical protein